MSLVGCGRTKPVRGLETTIPRDAGQPLADAGPVLQPDGGEIISGACEGLFEVCPRGFHCEAGLCVLNGASGELQVTLQWQNEPRTPDDLDLHVVEPDGCEIYYGTGSLFSCQPVGSLDLDANAACIDTASSAGLAFDTENIIYPVNPRPPTGHYVVRVDYWDECRPNTEVPFVVTVRKGTVQTTHHGVFHHSEADMGDVGSGVTVTEFDFP